MVSVLLDQPGTVVLTGRGRTDPTAGSVISDIVDVVKANKGISGGCKLTMSHLMNVNRQRQLKLKDLLS